MFDYVNNGTLLWFNKNPFDCGLNYELIGMVLGLSIYNNVNLDSNFPVVVYKKLMNQPVDFHDLEEIEPEICRSL